MGWPLWSVVIVLSGINTAFVFKLLYTYYVVPEEETTTVENNGLPLLKEEETYYWGRGAEPKELDDSIRKLEINITQDVLDELRIRLKNTRFFEALEDSQFNYGFHPDYLRSVVKYWMDKYHWKKYQDEINVYDHYLTNIEGIDVHFIHMRPIKKVYKVKVKPLLLIHGWPGSFYEFFKILPMLTNPVGYDGSAEDAFEVICVSLPGYGFSEAPHKIGFNVVDAARVFMKLMRRLAFKSYYVQGGDWGSIIATFMAKMYPEKIRGIHLNMIPLSYGPGMIIRQLIGSYFPRLFLDAKDVHKIYPLSEKFGFLLQETGYLHLQATKPDTVGAALMDSPAGLAAYILEKFSTWTDRDCRNTSDGCLTRYYELDDLLTNVMIYWITGSIASSMRLYKETIPSIMDNDPVTVRVGLASFPNELMFAPKNWAEYRFTNIITFTEMPRGGHFAALQEPRLLVHDIRKFVWKVEVLRSEEARRKVEQY